MKYNLLEKLAPTLIMIRCLRRTYKVDSEEDGLAVVNGSVFGRNPTFGGQIVV